ncbi:GntR family transcriptional regulator [Streptomyces pilosus]|uniref:GntR family transcriptional regulator n=1 Tax=Streptomyces pilosus TaxID=28893 RepID=UPI001F44487F|nr:GntR family transcriptional regulator [Streptomyces pilosus]
MVDGMRHMIVSGELVPGQQVRQEHMAERLGVSRLPVREALRQLTVEGLVRHTPNVGYTVTRLDQDEFDQIYIMRKLLEDEIISRLPRATKAQIAHISALNDEVAAAAENVDLPRMRERNTEFHFAVFGLSDLHLLIAEVKRLWTWAAPYHAVYLFSAESRRHVLEEHETMITALKTGDNDLLARTMDQHRHGSESQLRVLLSPGSSAATT